MALHDGRNAGNQPLHRMSLCCNKRQGTLEMPSILACAGVTHEGPGALLTRAGASSYPVITWGEATRRTLKTRLIV